MCKERRPSASGRLHAFSSSSKKAIDQHLVPLTQLLTCVILYLQFLLRHLLRKFSFTFTSEPQVACLPSAPKNDSLDNEHYNKNEEREKKKDISVTTPSTTKRPFSCASERRRKVHFSLWGDPEGNAVNRSSIRRDKRDLSLQVVCIARRERR